MVEVGGWGDISTGPSQITGLQSGRGYRACSVHDVTRTALLQVLHIAHPVIMLQRALHASGASSFKRK